MVSGDLYVPQGLDPRIQPISRQCPEIASWGRGRLPRSIFKQENGFMQQMETRSALSDSTSISADFLHPIEFLCGQHDRQREFCEQLGTLADDIWQLGHEKLALSLLEFATVDIANNFEDQSELFASALLRRYVFQAGTKKVVTDMVRRHHSVTTQATSTVDGLDRLASGEVPPVPIHFILSALQLVEVLSRNIDWEEDVLLPLVASGLTGADRRDLDSAMAPRRRGALFSMDSKAT